MADEQYKKLNNYLNDIFIYLSYRDSFLIDNIYKICILNSDFNKFIKKYEIKEESRENNLSFNDVYLLGREIIESINKDYLVEYDKLIETGILDFSYNREYLDSHFTKVNNQAIINLNRHFNYSDVIILVHEFFHYMNRRGIKTSLNRYLLTEFISIYFEMYAIEFLINNKHISKEEIDYNSRLVNTKEHSNNFIRYELILLAYGNFGNINKDSVNLLNQFFLNNLDEKQFNKDCLNVLNNLERMEKYYREDIRFEKIFNHQELAQEQSLALSTDYRYILGTLLAFYARKYSKIEDMVYLNDHINDPKYAYMGIDEICKSIGIDLNDEKFEEKLFNSMEEYINKYNGEVKNR